MAQQVGAVLERIAMDSSDPSTGKLPPTLTEADLGKLPAKWERQDIDWLLALSDEVMPPEMCSVEKAHKTLRLWAASCARRGDNDDGGDFKQRLYTGFLTSLTKTKVDGLVTEVLLKCKFFPSIAELHEMVKPEPQIWCGAWPRLPTGKPTQRALEAQKTLSLIKQEVADRRRIEKQRSGNISA